MSTSRGGVLSSISIDGGALLLCRPRLRLQPPANVPYPQEEAPACHPCTCFTTSTSTLAFTLRPENLGIHLTVAKESNPSSELAVTDNLHLHKLKLA